MTLQFATVYSSRHLHLRIQVEGFGLSLVENPCSARLWIVWCELLLEDAAALLCNSIAGTLGHWVFQPWLASRAVR